MSKENIRFLISHRPIGNFFVRGIHVDASVQIPVLDEVAKYNVATKSCIHPSPGGDHIIDRSFKTLFLEGGSTAGR